MPLQRQTQVLAMLDKLSGRSMRAALERYRAGVITPLVQAIDLPSASLALSQLGLPTFRRMRPAGLADAVERVGVRSHLIGRVAARLTRRRGDAETRRVPNSLKLLAQDDFDPRENADAERRLREKAAVTSEQFEALSKAARTKAFRVAEVHNARLIADVKKRIEDSLREGQSWAEVRRDLVKMFDTAGVPRPALHRLRLVFQTNVQQAYNDGRRESMEDPEVASAFPFWKYLTVGNGTAGYKNVRPDHAALHGLVFRADDPFWNSHYPPWSYNCRCTVIALTPGQAKAEGALSSQAQVRKKGGRPDPNFQRGEIDTAGIDAEIAAVIAARE